MSLYKPKNSSVWWVDITPPEGRRVRQSTGTTVKRDAQELHDRLKNDLWRQTKLGEKPKYSWNDAVKRYLTEQAEMRTLEQEKRLLRFLTEKLRGKQLSSITRDTIDDITQSVREGRSSRTKNGTSNATVNRHLECLRRVLNRAEGWGWLDTVPLVSTLPEPAGRLRWLTKEEAERLLSNLPPHLAAPARFTLLTGLRAQNCVKLEWGQVDLGRNCLWIHADQSKSGKPYSVPLSKAAAELLGQQKNLHERWVFPYAGKPLAQPSTQAWYKALSASGITDFTWHGLRHTWASWHVMAGTPLEVLQKLGGWARYEMVLRYAHLSSGYIHQYADNIEL
jgi:integrase